MMARLNKRLEYAGVRGGGGGLPAASHDRYGTCSNLCMMLLSSATDENRHGQSSARGKRLQIAIRQLLWIGLKSRYSSLTSSSIRPLTGNHPGLRAAGMGTGQQGE